MFGLIIEILADHESDYSDQCHEFALSIYDTARNDMPLHWVDKDWLGLINDINTVFRSIHPMTETCIQTFDDYYNSMVNYYETFTEPMLLVYNILYHLGAIYTAVEEAIRLIKNQEDLSQLGWQEIGREIGKVWYQLFFNIGDYDYPDIDMDYPDEFLEDWEIAI